MKDEKKSRIYGIDILKIIAVCLVLAVHFFLNTNYYGAENSGISMKIQTIIRNFCMICVPLFIMITGFLNKKTEYNKSFFKGLINILIVWAFYSIIEYFVINALNSKHVLDLRSFIYSFTSFNACHYSWYIEMYIGLYLMSPVINNAYNSFNKKNRLILLLITIFSIVLPPSFNVIFDGVIHMPSLWAIYPLAYYILGKYIEDIKPKFNKKILIFLLIITQILTLSYNQISAIDHNSLTTFISTVIVFLLFYNIDIKKNFLRKSISYISNITLDIYLASSLIDKFVYYIFNSKMMSMDIYQNKVILFAPIVLIIIFTLSAIYGSIRKLIINVR